MKCVNLVFLLVCTAVNMESVLGDDEALDTTTGGCMVQVPEGMPSMWSTLQSKVSACMNENTWITSKHVREANTTEDFRLAVKNACDEKATFDRCLSDGRSEAEVCLEGAERTEFVLRVGLLAREFEARCVGDGVRFATLIEEQQNSYDPHFESPLDIFSKCQLEAPARVALVLNETQDPNHRTKYEYHRLEYARECLQRHRGQGKDVLVESGVGHLTDIIDSMECVDPTGGGYVLCKTIINNQGSS